VSTIPISRSCHGSETLSFGILQRFFAALLSRARQRKALRHLGALDDHVLRDIGLERTLIVVAVNADAERVCAVPSELGRL
jgi:uncharacterized protein YjiS (DUF1127 family)